MDRKNKKSIVAIFIAIVFYIASLAISSVNAYAIEVEGSETGLRANVSGVLVPTDNLAPGDTKTSSMTISLASDSNVKENTLPVWLSAEIIENIPGKSVDGIKGNLDDRLEFTIRFDNGKVLYDKSPASGLSKPIVLGQIAKGESFNIYITVHLPGEATGNEYQAASIKVKWKVITMYSPESDPSPTPTPTPTEPTPTEPTPTEPTPAEPTPTEPTPAEPTPTEPTPAEPTPTEPTPAEPTPTEPTPTEPTPTNPSPTPKTSTDVLFEIESELVPEGSPEPQLVIIEEELLPSGLPKTGELPPILYYCLGAGIIYTGLRINKKKQ